MGPQQSSWALKVCISALYYISIKEAVSNHTQTDPRRYRVNSTQFQTASVSSFIDIANSDSDFDVSQSVSPFL